MLLPHNCHAHVVNKLTTRTDQSQYCIDHCFRRVTVTESLETEIVFLSEKQQCGAMKNSDSLLWKQRSAFPGMRALGGRHGFGNDKFLTSAFLCGAFSIGTAVGSIQYHVQAWKILNTAFLVGGQTDVKEYNCGFLCALCCMRQHDITLYGSI